jgi:hypothetical protein
LGQTCAIGRPLMVSGVPCTAKPRDRSDWAAEAAAPDVGTLDPSLRSALARHWLEVAALEHASVASFARFTLELLALGAPPGLVGDAQRAALDEVEHARLAYGLASSYLGRPVGPAALDIRGLEVSRDARNVMRALVVEGCIGETVGAAEALALAQTVADPALRRVHARVAADEQRHAELAWRALAWLLDLAGGDVAREAARLFAELDTTSLSSDSADPGVAAPPHGLLTTMERAAIRRQAVGEVIAPCAEALLARVVPRGAHPFAAPHRVRVQGVA